MIRSWQWMVGLVLGAALAAGAAAQERTPDPRRLAGG